MPQKNFNYYINKVENVYLDEKNCDKKTKSIHLRC